MASQGVLSVGFRACGEMSGKEFALPPLPIHRAVYGVFNRVCLSINSSSGGRKAFLFSISIIHRKTFYKHAVYHRTNPNG